ncbi:hypothetical protein Slin15195_G115290 [Septoria linicola]|uniref:Uncharacterized protein n=1 Tax=Septoria linicola TaxID=215465 RepID=A0A9Q9B4R0_9PEZI|nr:hypothetical protein Slin15195_G115290 [Septoria linicola]
MLLSHTTPVLLLAAVADNVNASPSYQSGNKICFNVKKCDQPATRYCSSYLRIPVKTKTTTICKTTTIVKTSTAIQDPTPATTVTVTEIPTITTCRQPAIPSTPADKNKRNAPPQYKPNCLKSYSGKSLSSACKYLPIKTSTTTVRTTKFVKTITQTTTTTKKAGQQSTVTSTETAAAPVFAVPTAPLNLFALNKNNDDGNGPNQYLRPLQSGAGVRQGVAFDTPQALSPRIRFDGTTLTGVDAPLTDLVAGIGANSLPGTVGVVFDSLDAPEFPQEVATCRITSGPDGTCPVVCTAADFPFSAFLELWSLSSEDSGFNLQLIDIFAVSPLVGDLEV